MRFDFFTRSICAVLVLFFILTGCKNSVTENDTNIDNTESSNSVQNNNSSQLSAFEIPNFMVGDSDKDETIELLPITASNDGLLDRNPDRGYRSEIVLRIDSTRRTDKKHDSRTVFADESEKIIRSTMETTFNFYFKDAVSNDRMFLAYIYLTDYHNSDLSDDAMKAIKIFFEICRERKVKSMLRFCYNWSYAKNFKLSDENKKLLASECADEATILHHIEQLKPLIAEYSDTIHTISNGFIGYVGEWAYSYQYPEVDYPTVMKAIVEKLCVPNGLYFSNRDPEYKNQLIEREPDYKYLRYIGNNNDAMFGEQTNKDWYSGNMQLGRPEWQQVTDEAAYTPQDGEMFTLNAVIDTDHGRYYNPRVPSGLQMILECAHHRHTSMSNWHCYAEALSPSHKNYENNIMLNWKTKHTITEQELIDNKIIYDPAWFYDDEGNKVTRNPYDFIKDHLGYRLVASKISTSTNNDNKINVTMNFKNYGFAAAFMLESGFAVLDDEYNVIETIKAGEPEKWYSHDPENYLSTEVIEHSIDAALPLPTESGKYYIAFYLKNTMNDGARLSNKVNFKNGHNILYAFEIN